MFESHEVNAEHKDLIHDVAYDYYGRRMATCSSDQYVKVKKVFPSYICYLMRKVVLICSRYLPSCVKSLDFIILFYICVFIIYYRCRYQL